jgi:hypothetical protein
MQRHRRFFRPIEAVQTRQTKESNLSPGILRAAVLSLMLSGQATAQDTPATK